MTNGTPSITVDQLSLFAATRYALGRMTYIVSVVVNDLLNNWHLLSSNQRDRLVHEIKEAIQKGHAGMEMDVKEWKKVIELHSKTKQAEEE